MSSDATTIVPGRRPRCRRSASAAVSLAGLAVAAVLAGCGSSHGAGGGSTSPATVPSAGANTLSLSPAHPTTHSTITFTYTAPVATGVHGDHVIADSLSVVGPNRPGCEGAHEQNGPAARAGQRVSLTVGPAQLGRPWCAGPYTARVIELQSAHCHGSTPCPQYIRVVGVIARTTFSVARG